MMSHISSIVNEWIISIILGHLESHRPVLEATFHKMLVQTQPEKRLDALKAISKLLSEKDGLLNLCWMEDSNDKEEEIPIGTATDMAILIM